ncbi:MAG: threonine/serine exporter family protein [Hungatella sp.]
MILQVLAAVIGTVGFSVLYGVPRQYYPYCGLIGGAGWLLYSLLIPWCSTPEATLFATVLVILLSRLFAVRKRCPVTIFLIPGIFSLVPGAGLYWTSYYIVTNDVELAAQTGFTALKVAVAIVLGIVFVFQLPQRIFRVGMKKDKRG